MIIENNDSERHGEQETGALFNVHTAFAFIFSFVSNSLCSSQSANDH